MEKKDTNAPIPNTIPFEELIQRTASNSGYLTEFFRLNIIYYQLISGKGLEFDQIRIYNPGDDPRRIDWKIYARTNELNIRTYKEERNLDIIIVLDGSNSMLVGTKEYTKNEYGSIIAGVLATAALDAGDNVGGGIFSNEKQKFIDPESDFIHLLNIFSESENYGGEKNWPKLTNELLTNYAENAIIFIISDFINTKPELFLPELATKFARVYGIMLRDPVDQEFPDHVGPILLKDPSNGKVILADSKKVHEEYKLLNIKQMNKIKDLFHQYGQKCFTIVTGEDFSTAFIKALGDEQVEIS